ncbi:MAG: SDR family oxidoreductase [Microthrixaceae bacterium]
MTSFDDAHVIITGGSEGIGLAIAQSAVERGARVSLIARREEPLKSASEGLAGRSQWAAADVRDRAEVTAAVDDLVDSFGPCDILVANAGYALPGRFWELPEDEVADEMAVNYMGAVNATKAVLPSMRGRRRGHLCFTSSTAGLLGIYGYTAYSPTKFALRGLAESLRSELRPDGIAVSVIYPPDTDTPGFAKENEHKPVETAAISGTIRPKSANEVAISNSQGN